MRSLDQTFSTVYDQSKCDVYSKPATPARIRLPSMKPYGPLKPTALPSFLACSILGHSPCLERQSSCIRSSAKRIPSSLHTDEVFVLYQISSLITCFAKMIMIWRCLFSVILPTLCTMSIASSIFVARSGAILRRSSTTSALTSLWALSFLHLICRHHLLLYLSRLFVVFVPSCHHFPFSVSICSSTFFIFILHSFILDLGARDFLLLFMFSTGSID